MVRRGLNHRDTEDTEKTKDKVREKEETGIKRA
jgi:hypothetical protein